MSPANTAAPAAPAEFDTRRLHGSARTSGRARSSASSRGCRCFDTRPRSRRCRWRSPHARPLVRRRRALDQRGARLTRARSSRRSLLPQRRRAFLGPKLELLLSTARAAVSAARSHSSRDAERSTFAKSWRAAKNRAVMRIARCTAASSASADAARASTAPRATVAAAEQVVVIPGGAARSLGTGVARPCAPRLALVRVDARESRSLVASPRRIKQRCRSWPWSAPAKSRRARSRCAVARSNTCSHCTRP